MNVIQEKLEPASCKVINFYDLDELNVYLDITEGVVTSITEKVNIPIYTVAIVGHHERI